MFKYLFCHIGNYSIINTVVINTASFLGRYQFLLKNETLKYLCSFLTNQNCIHGEIKSRLNVENSCYYFPVRKMSSRLLSKNSIINTNNNYLLYYMTVKHDVLRAVRRLRVCENKITRGILGPKRDENKG